MTSFQRKDGRFVKTDDPRIVPTCNTHEDWFTHTEWIAEFWCTVSMLPLAFAGLWAMHSGLWLGGALSLHATVASAVSHAVPYRRLLQWDIVAARALALWSLTLFRWELWPWFAMPLAVGALDLATRRSGYPIHGLHPFWHCAPAISFCVVLATQ